MVHFNLSRILFHSILWLVLSRLILVAIGWNVREAFPNSQMTSESTLLVRLHSESWA